MMTIYTAPEAANQAALQAWLAMKDRTGLAPVVFEADSGFEPGVWPRMRLDELPEGVWTVQVR